MQEIFLQNAGKFCQLYPHNSLIFNNKDVFLFQKNTMKICMIDGDFPPDVRVENEAYSLIQGGHEVHIIAMNKRNRSIEEVFSGIKIHRLRWISILPGRLNRWANISHFLNLRWLFKIIAVSREYRIDVIHVHDLPLAPIAIIAGKMFSVPVVFDNHEYYPAFLRIVGYRGIILCLLFNPLLFDFIDRVCKRLADFLICTAEESKTLFIRNGIPSKKVYTLMNTVNLSTFLNVEIKDEIIKKYRPYYTIIYVGGFGKHRNIELPIRALPYLVKKVPNIRLVIVGGDKKRGRSLVNLASSLEILKYIDFTGWVDSDLIPSYIQASDICIIPHIPALHTNTTTPHKLFQYMAMGKPIIATPIIPVKSIIEEEGCGIIVSHINPMAFANAVLTLFRDEGKVNQLGGNGRNAVLKKYNWAKTSQNLLVLYKNITRDSHVTNKK